MEKGQAVQECIVASSKNGGKADIPVVVHFVLSFWNAKIIASVLSDIRLTAYSFQYRLYQ